MYSSPPSSSARLVSCLRQSVGTDGRTDRQNEGHGLYYYAHWAAFCPYSPPSVSVYRRRRRHHHCVQCVKQDQRKGEGERERGQARTTMDLRSAEAACLSALFHPTKTRRKCPSRTCSGNALNAHLGMFHILSYTGLPLGI